MKAPKSPASVEMEMKRSRFIAYLISLAEFEPMKDTLRHRYPRANHIAWAWRHINEYAQTVERASDDGEPRGCAGAPILSVLRGTELVESAILVVRIFGGIKLGTGGMARAYGAAARAAVEAATLQDWEATSRLRFASGFGAQRQIRYIMERLGIGNVSCYYNSEKEVLWEIEAPLRALERFTQEAGRLIELSSR